jgi:multiple sugar transport system permease protein
MATGPDNRDLLTRRRGSAGAVQGSSPWLPLAKLALLTALSAAMLVPFCWMILTSFKTRQEAGTPTMIPTEWHPENYLVVLGRDTAQWLQRRLLGVDGAALFAEYRDLVFIPPAERTPEQNARIKALAPRIWGMDRNNDQYLPINFPKWYFNSLFIATWVTFLQLVTSSMAAYAFARLHWPGRDKVFLLYLATMMIPGLVLIIPNYYIMFRLELIDSYTGLILPAAFSAFGTFLLRQFMLTIPTSLDEAAEIDGASRWQIFTNVILPLSRPGLIVLAIFTFLSNYGSLFWPLILVKSEHLKTLPIGMLFFEYVYGRQTEFMMAAAVMNIVPLILLFIVLQKYLVRGIQLGAVKG